MKGHCIFTHAEWAQIKQLVSQKITSRIEEQKLIRNKIREIGFFFSDFSSKKGYDLNDLDNLVLQKLIRIVDDNLSIHLAQHRPHPLILNTTFQMQNPNESILVYSGAFILKRKAKQIEVEGEVIFTWWPSPLCKFKGQVKSPNFSSLDLIASSTEAIMSINGYDLGIFDIMNADQHGNIDGHAQGLIIQGDRSVPITTVHFSLPNFKNLYGSTVREETVNQLGLLNNRWTLTSTKYDITIDQLSDYRERNDKLKFQGGYIFQYAAKLESTKGHLEFETLQNLLPCLNHFLSFINGRRTSALLLKCIHDEKVIFEDWTSYIVDNYLYVDSWAPEFCQFIPQKAWKGFEELWKNQIDRDFLKMAIHWYLEANAQSGYVEGSLIMAQTALELIYNWFVIEKKKLITGEDARNISASNKIRLLLSTIGISNDIPSGLSHLINLQKVQNDILDGPESIVQIRNAIVHAQLEKRKKLNTISGIVRSEALDLCLWYIELSLLFILGYDGKYVNRCTGLKWKGQSEQQVPWSVK